MSKHDQIKIYIAGRAAAGKSTITKLIMDALDKEGFNVLVRDSESPNYLMDPEMQKKRLNSLREKYKNRVALTIETVCTKLSPTKEEVCQNILKNIHGENPGDG